MLRRVGGVGLVTMEFISSEAISRGNARQLRKMVFSDEEAGMPLASPARIKYFKSEGF